MAKWLDKLEDAGRKAVADAKPPRPAPKLECVVVTTRYADPETGDPGAARYGFYYVEDGILHMTDAAGNALRGEDDRPVTVTFEDGSDARAIAASLTRRRSGSNRPSGFERGPLRYPPGRYGC
jgi:hypothetical protein